MSLFILDTSALCAHFMEENGWQMVQDLFDDPEEGVTIAAVTLFEFHFVLKAKGVAVADITETTRIYGDVLSNPIPADAEAVREAIRLRESVPGRLTLADALIAGCAVSREATLVHRDKHLSEIPDRLLKQIRLPHKV
ncbi:MAG: hypothetical protein C0404_01815 [Verrucomicrobia bacterium]|nr:hypothetical protein [Verrucomicrobiota bacterium]